MNRFKRMIFVLFTVFSMLAVLAPTTSAAVTPMDVERRALTDQLRVIPVIADGVSGPVSSRENHSSCWFNDLYAYNGPSTGKTMMYASASCSSGTGRHILSGSIKPLYGSTVYSSGLFFSTHAAFYLNSQSYYVGTYTLRGDVCGVNDGRCHTWVRSYWVG